MTPTEQQIEGCCMANLWLVCGDTPYIQVVHSRRNSKNLRYEIA
jgi:hypothetical protein